LVILESTIIFSVKKQNRTILLYGLLLLIGMLPFYLLGEGGGGVWIENNLPRFGPFFLIFIIGFTASFVVIPIINTFLKIYKSFETRALKKKWAFFFVGSLGAFSIPYTIWINNLVFYDKFRLIVGIYAISMILWGYLMYYGIGFKLKQ
jgi:DMSO reductase anchor subunit